MRYYDIKVELDQLINGLRGVDGSMVRRVAGSRGGASLRAKRAVPAYGGAIQKIVIPAKAGIQSVDQFAKDWISPPKADGNDSTLDVVRP